MEQGNVSCISDQRVEAQAASECGAVIFPITLSGRALKLRFSCLPLSRFKTLFRPVNLFPLIGAA